MIKWKKHNKTKAFALLSELNTKTPYEFKRYISKEFSEKDFDEEYYQLRKSLVDAFDIKEKLLMNTTINNEVGNKAKYNFDLELGIELHKILHKAGFTERQAGNIKIWYYLTTEVFLDYVYYRIGSTDSENLKFSKYICRETRMTLPTVWWFVHLSLQLKPDNEPDYELTRKILKNSSTDTIMQLVDRRGSGYWLEFTRVLMKLLFDLNKTQTRNSNFNFFSNLLALHLISTIDYDPHLSSISIDHYCEHLIKQTEDLQNDVF